MKVINRFFLKSLIVTLILFFLIQYRTRFKEAVFWYIIYSIASVWFNGVQPGTLGV
jgi:hypothetical protein